MADFGAIRALAFDLDGTLVDSAPGLAAAIDMALEETGLPQAGEERVGTWIGNGADVLVQRARCAGRKRKARRSSAAGCVNASTISMRRPLTAVAACSRRCKRRWPGWPRTATRWRW